MTVSIIIPHLNDGTKYLQDCLDSINAQAFKDVQILVEEDETESSRGVAAMRNRALEKVTGDYCLFLDSDDYLGSEALTSAVFTASMNPGSIIRMLKVTTSYKYATTIECEEKEMRARMKADRENDLAGNDFSDGPTAVLTRPEQFTDSCLGLLIPGELIRNLRFEENYRYYSDIPFMAGLYGRAEFVNLPDARYYSRKRNDPVWHPALSQEINPERFTEYCNALRLAKGMMENSGLISSYVCEFLVSRTVRHLNPKAMGWNDKDLNEFCRLVRDVAVPGFEFYGGESLRVLKKFEKGNIRGIRRMVKAHHRKEKLRLMRRSKHQRRLLLYNKIFTKLPVKKDMVLFSAFFGRNYCDSPRRIFEYMRDNYPDKHYIWVMNDPSMVIPDANGNPCKTIKTDSVAYYYYLARAALYVNNVRQPEWFIKRKNTVMLETWHGTPLKKLVFDLEDVFAAKPLDYKKKFYNQACQWDYLISDNAFSTEAFMSAFRYPKHKILEIGYPRNDILYSPEKDSLVIQLKNALGLPLDKKIVLYAPTWRDDEVEGQGEYGFSLKLELNRLEALSDEYHFILRTHYLISDALKLTDKQREYVTDLSKYDDIAELYLLSDVLITDYSSVFFDYANLRRPILFYVYDLEKYRDTLHGFYFDMTTGCPGPMLRTTADVVNALQNLDDITFEYKEIYDEFYEKFCSLDDGNASKRVVDILMKQV